MALFSPPVFRCVFCSPQSCCVLKKLRNGSYVYEPFSFTLKKKWSGQASSAVAITTVLVVVPERVLQSSLAPHPVSSEMLGMQVGVRTQRQLEAKMQRPSDSALR